MMKASAPLVFGFVLLFAFLLLLVAFRSIVVALKAILLNLLSVAAAYGMLVAVFQWGWGENLLDFNSTGGIASWLPMFLFVILFGLSMDYHVFILSRIRESFDRGMKTEDAVEHGIRTTAGVVTGASVVMVAVFSVFALTPLLDLKEMGIGLAAAILIDATIVRAVLLPATMMLLGDRNWYLPKWLEWLPTLEHERSAEPAAPRPPRARFRAGRLSRALTTARCAACHGAEAGGAAGNLDSKGDHHAAHRRSPRPGAPPRASLARHAGEGLDQRGNRPWHRLAIGDVALHVVDDAFLQPNPGTSAGDHLASGLVPLALLVAAGACLRSWPRRRCERRPRFVVGFLGVLAGSGVRSATTR